MTNEKLIKKLQDMAWPDCRISIEVSPRTSGVAVPTPRHVTSFSVKEFIEMLTPEQPQTPSEGEDSTETMVEVVADDTPVIPGKSNLAADYVKHSSFDPGIAALSNGSAEQTE